MAVFPLLQWQKKNGVFQAKGGGVNLRTENDERRCFQKSHLALGSRTGNFFTDCNKGVHHSWESGSHWDRALCNRMNLVACVMMLSNLQHQINEFRDGAKRRKEELPDQACHHSMWQKIIAWLILTNSCLLNLKMMMIIIMCRTFVPGSCLASPTWRVSFLVVLLSPMLHGGSQSNRTTTLAIRTPCSF